MRRLRKIGEVPKHRSAPARALADAQYRPRVVKSKKNYSRKGRQSSTRQACTGEAMVEDSI